MSANLREKLLSYIEIVDDKKIEALFVLLEDDINNQDYVLTDEQLAIVEEEREKYLRGESKGYTQEEAMNLIRGKAGVK